MFSIWWKVFFIFYFRVILYPSNGLGKPKTVKYYKEKAYSGRFRCDGELIINGTEDGGIHIHDTKKRVLLRSIKGHSEYFYLILLVQFIHVYFQQINYICFQVLMIKQ